ncbi:hypothetical protein WME76_47430 (plasmid) [Sorangium sp. So ce119]|uniref:hypothetical protein n=1 Tax=Sorangium sp. So ce119 TaxID=3133279 RepID=UPI003F5DCC98
MVADVLRDVDVSLAGCERAEAIAVDCRSDRGNDAGNPCVNDRLACFKRRMADGRQRMD